MIDACTYNSILHSVINRTLSFIYHFEIAVLTKNKKILNK